MTIDRYDPLARPAAVFGNEAVGAPSSATEIGRLLYRVEQLEKRLSLIDRPADAPTETAVWGRETPIVAASPVWPVRAGRVIYEYILAARVAQTGGTTSVDLYWNGNNIATASLTSGQTSKSVTLGQRVTQGDLLWVVSTSLGTGPLAGLGAQARMY